MNNPSWSDTWITWLVYFCTWATRHLIIFLWACVEQILLVRTYVITAVKVHATYAQLPYDGHHVNSQPSLVNAWDSKRDVTNKKIKICSLSFRRCDYYETARIQILWEPSPLFTMPWLLFRINSMLTRNADENPMSPMMMQCMRWGRLIAFTAYGKILKLRSCDLDEIQQWACHGTLAALVWPS